MKQQIFINDVHEYDYEFLQTGNGKIHNLYYSNGGEWTERVKGMVTMSIRDDGNDLRVTFKNYKFSLDYAEAERLFVLLKLATQSAKYEIAEKKLL